MNHHAEIPNEPERLPGGLIAAVAGGTIVAIVGSAIAVWLLAGRAHGGGVRQVAPPAEVHAIDTPPYGSMLEAERVRRAQRESIDRWLDAAIDRFLIEHGGVR